MPGGVVERPRAPRPCSSPIHSKVAVDDLLHGVIIQSGNDACIVLAEGISGSENEFAELMTKRARETRPAEIDVRKFERPARSAPAHDLPRTRQARSPHHSETYPEYYKIYGEREFTWNKIRQYNRNPLLAMSIGADGMKTGFTKEAGYGLVGSAVQNGVRLIVVVNGLRSEKERADEGKRLLEWGFNTFQSGTLFAEGQEIAEAKVYGGETRPRAAGRRQGRAADGSARVARADHRARRLQWPGARAGRGGPEDRHLKVWRGDTHGAGDAAAGGNERRHRDSMHQRAIDAASELVIGLFRAGFQRL